MKHQIGDSGNQMENPVFFLMFFFGFEDVKPKGTAFEMCRHVQELVFICFHGIRKIRSWRIF